MFPSPCLHLCLLLTVGGVRVVAAGGVLPPLHLTLHLSGKKGWTIIRLWKDGRNVWGKHSVKVCVCTDRDAVHRQERKHFTGCWQIYTAIKQGFSLSCWSLPVAFPCSIITLHEAENHTRRCSSCLHYKQGCTIWGKYLIAIFFKLKYFTFILNRDRIKIPGLRACL